MMDNIRETIENQKLFVKKGHAREYAFRLKYLKSLKKNIEQNENAIYEALHKDLGKSEEEAFLTEYGIVIKEIEYFISNLKDLMKPEKISTPLFTFKSKGEIIKEPYGLVLIMSPWNYPFQLSFLPMIGALAAGNAVVVKPSEFSSSTSKIIEEIIRETFPIDYVSVVQGAVPETTFLLEMKFDYIFFTGSTKVGKIVMKAAANHLTPVTLELGGKSPAIVCKDSDLEIAARRIVWGKFINAGQTCIAPDYVYVERKIKDKFVQSMINSIREFYGEYPKKSRDYGRIISVEHLERLVGLFENDNLIHGGFFDAKERYLSPTIVSVENWEDPLMKEEIFGPILPILEFEDFEEVAEIINDQPKPLALYLFTKSSRDIDFIKKNVSFGGGCINDTILHLASHDLPFGGVGESGMGTYHGKYSFETFSHSKSMLEKTFKPDFGFRYPPYKNNINKLKKFI